VQVVVAWGLLEVGQARPTEGVGPKVHLQDLEAPKAAAPKALDERDNHQDLEAAMETVPALEAAMPMEEVVAHFHPWEVAMVPPLCVHAPYLDSHAVLVSET